MKSRLIAGVLAIMLPALAFGGNTSYKGYATGKTTAYGGYANKERRDNKEITFGKIGFAVNGVLSMPSGDIARVLNATIGPELSLTYRNFLIKDFHLQMSGDFMTYTGKVDIANTFSTVSAVLSGRYDLKLKEIPGTLYLSAGGGAGFETLTVGGIVLDNIDPQYRIGVGYEAAAFDNFTVRFDIKYVVLPQKYIAGSTRDGSFINIYAGVNMEFGVDADKRKASESSSLAMK